MMAAVMIGLAPLKPILYSNNPATPIRNRAASLPIFPASNSTAAKSRRVSSRRISRGTEASKATCVKHTKSGELRLYAASAENGACIANSNAVARE